MTQPDGSSWTQPFLSFSWTTLTLVQGPLPVHLESFNSLPSAVPASSLLLPLHSEATNKPCQAQLRAWSLPILEPTPCRDWQNKSLTPHHGVQAPHDLTPFPTFFPHYSPSHAFYPIPEYPEHQSVVYHLCDFCHSCEPPECVTGYCPFKSTIFSLINLSGKENNNKKFICKLKKKPVSLFEIEPNSQNKDSENKTMLWSSNQSLVAHLKIWICKMWVKKGD